MRSFKPGRPVVIGGIVLTGEEASDASSFESDTTGFPD